MSCRAGLTGHALSRKEVLIPVVDELIIHADQKKRKIYVNLPEGLLDVYLSPFPRAEADESGQIKRPAVLNAE